ncbi:MAG TPA: hypothetical protein DCM54_12045 [Gammaproteobacteria bacterium]|nr:hypothetical protein [Gammaproteobacteria bacterium]|tara:strand:+ start:380 stop:814 length:435 start_codon:yes stop_codon:yes gene_type:complete
MDCEHYREMLSGLIDNELNPEEANTVNQHLSRCTECRAEYDALVEHSDKLNSLSFREPQDIAMENFWRLPFSGFARNAGLILVIVGYLLLVAYGFTNFFLNPEEDLIGKIALAALIIGGLIVFGMALIERLTAYKTDPYKEIDR